MSTIKAEGLRTKAHMELTAKNLNFKRGTIEVTLSIVTDDTSFLCLCQIIKLERFSLKSWVRTQEKRILDGKETNQNLVSLIEDHIITGSTVIVEPATDSDEDLGVGVFLFYKTGEMITWSRVSKQPILYLVAF